MSIWTPEWSLTVNGNADFKSVTLADVSITSGRTDIYQQATAGYAAFTILNFDDSAVTINLNDQVSIKVKDSAGDFVNLFGGYVTDIDLEVTNAGTGGMIQNLKVIALGSLSKLPKSLTNGVLSKDFDGVQIETILAPLLFNTWNEVPAATAWNTYDPTTTWENAENSGLGEIDEGNYELTSRSSSQTDVYSLVAALANSGLGYLYEDAQGRICYADSTHRIVELGSSGYTTISGNTALAAGIKTSLKSGDIRNSVTITYKNNASVSASDSESIATYGFQAQSIQTTLEDTADAIAQANFYLGIRAFPEAQFRSITFPLGNPEIDDSNRDSLLNVYMGLPIEIIDLPNNIGEGRFQGFVEGWTLRASYNGLAITLTVSPTAYSLQAARWNDVSASETWNTLSTTMDWNDAIIVV
ncbi:MAG: hypothetical protein ACR2IJ_11105 [Fluviibacter sp.]